jgi:acetyl-CoA carboxylase biotin carboxyl carrier protein
VDEAPSQHQVVHAVDEALAAIQGSSIAELEVEWEDGHLRLHRDSSAGTMPFEPVSEASAPADDRIVVISEHVGVFHGGAGGPFPRPGAWVGAGTQLGEIETLGIRNPVTAAVDGRLEDVLVDDGAAVEYGQPIANLRPEARPTEPSAGDTTEHDA